MYQSPSGSTWATASQNFTYLPECPSRFPDKDHHDERSQDQTAGHAGNTKLPSILPFPCPGIHTHHNEDNVGRGEYVEYLEGEVPEGVKRARRVIFDVERHGQVSGDEDYKVPYLSLIHI